MDLQALLDSIFKKTVMDAIVDEFVTPPTKLRFTNAFLPYKEVADERLIGLIRNAMFGLTSPASYGGEHQHLKLPGFRYKEAVTGVWRESTIFGEKELQKMRDPANPNQRLGTLMLGNALNMQDLRILNRIEQLSTATVFNKGYTIAEFGVNYSYDSKLPPKYYIDLAASPASGYVSPPTWWIPTPADTNKWSDTTNSDPIRDIKNIQRHFSRMGLVITDMWLNSYICSLIEQNTKVRTFITASYSLSEKMITTAKLLEILPGFGGLKLEIDDECYLDETYHTNSSTAGDATIVVADSKGMTHGDVLTLRNSSDQEEDVIIHASTDIDTTTPGAHVITLAAGTTLRYSYEVGDRVQKAYPFLPDDQVAFRVAPNPRAQVANWYSIPSIIKGTIDNPLPGKYTWSDILPPKVPPRIEVGTGIDGGPIVWYPGGWVVMKIK